MKKIWLVALACSVLVGCSGLSNSKDTVYINAYEFNIVGDAKVGGFNGSLYSYRGSTDETKAIGFFIELPGSDTTEAEDPREKWMLDSGVEISRDFSTSEHEVVLNSINPETVMCGWSGYSFSEKKECYKEVNLLVATKGQSVVPYYSVTITLPVVSDGLVENAFLLKTYSTSEEKAEALIHTIMANSSIDGLVNGLKK